MNTERFKIFAVLLSLVIAFPPSLAWSQGKRKEAKVVVGAVSVPSSLLSQERRLRTGIVNAFHHQPGVQLASRKDVDAWRKRVMKEDQPEDRSAEELNYARELLSQGKRDYEQFRFEESIQSLREARRIFIYNLPALRSNRDLIDTHLWLGVVYAVTKKDSQAKEEFRRVVYLDSKRELDRRGYAPNILKLFTEVKREVMKASLIRVRVESSVPGAVVYLNGRSVGNAPLEMRLLPGEYFVLVEKKGLKPWYKPIRFKQRIETVRASLKPETGGQKWLQTFRVREGEDQSNPDLSLLRDLAKSVGSEIVFLGSVEKKYKFRILGQLYDVRTSQFSKVAMVDLEPNLRGYKEDAQSLVDTLMEFVRSDGYVVSPGAPNLVVPGQALTVGAADRPQPAIMNAPAEKKLWYERWWVWPLIVGAGVGLFFGVREAISSDTSGGIVLDNRGNF